MSKPMKEFIAVLCLVSCAIAFVFLTGCATKGDIQVTRQWSDIGDEALLSATAKSLAEMEHRLEKLEIKHDEDVNVLLDFIDEEGKK